MNCKHDWLHLPLPATPSYLRWCKHCGALGENGKAVLTPTYRGLPIVGGLLADKSAKTQLTERASEAETQLRAEGNIS